MIEPIERLYTETEAAELLGIKPRSLRTERVAGRIGFKRVAGKIMYRHSDLQKWMEQGEEPCRDQTEDRTSSISKRGAATTSPGPKTDGAGAAAQVRAISSRLKRRSKTSSPADPDG
ncbi:MAG: helix-turn-helix domain-containing protein [Proteobacteria bacterium]|nr:helix-turn-helix domain-containing protein [Pseudomonadota bacterium]